MIRAENLSKIFRTETIQTSALQAVNFSVKQGEFVAVMGPSGCGKSTLLNILGLLDSPDSGEYYFDGTPTSAMNEMDRTRMRKGKIGFVFQSFNLIDELTVYENVELPLLALRIKPSERKERVTAVLDKMQINHRRSHFPQQLSGGQQQRVAIARAVVANPKLILADEPTGNLDSANGEQVMQLIEELNTAGTTIVMVTHSEMHAARAHRVVNLLDGQILIERKDHHFHIA
ncbi:MAG: ABC transporter ATP-binding protein [Bacteroidales bacterium]|nr:ABC transporter ATP-binding protein [Bacteroidales bacterium]